MSIQTEAEIAVELYRRVTDLMRPAGASLDQIRQRNRVEVVHDRDPDSSCNITVFIDGQRIDHHDEYSCDAGAGYDWPDWLDSRASEIAEASAPVAAELRESAVSPCGSEYIENMPDREDERCRQLDALVAQYKGEPPPGMQTWTFYGHWDEDRLVIDHASLGAHEDVYPDDGSWEGGSFADTGTGRTIGEAESDLRQQYGADDDDDDDTGDGDDHAPPVFAFVQQGGSSVEYYLFVHDTYKSACKHQKSCNKATYVTSDIYEVRGDADFDAIRESVENSLGHNDWVGVARILGAIAV